MELIKEIKTYIKSEREGEEENMSKAKRARDKKLLRVCE